MKRICVLFLGFVVAGCVKPMAHYRTLPPTVSYVTAKTAEQSMRCLATAFEGVPVMPQLAPSGDGWTFNWPDVDNRMFVDVQPVDGGARVDFHRHGITYVGGNFREAVESCRD